MVLMIGVCLLNPSPNNVNLNSLNGYVDKPQFSYEPGSYDNPITIRDILS